MWTKFSHALSKQQARPGDVNNEETDTLAGPSTSPSKRKGVLKLHRDDGSLRLNSPLKLPNIHIPKKVKSTFNLHGNSSQLTLSGEPIPSSSRDLARRSSQELLSTSPRPKATRRSSFNILTRRPSLDALRSPPETPRSMSCRDEPPSFNSNRSRSRAATFGGSVRSILREPNTPGTGKNVRFFSRDAYDVVTPEHSAEAEYQPLIRRSTPPEETFLHCPQWSNSTSNSATPRFASSSRRSSRPTVAEIFSPLGTITSSPQMEEAPHRTDFFQQLEVPAISSLTAGLSDALTSTPCKDGVQGGIGDRESGLSKGAPVQIDGPSLHTDKAPRLPSIPHERSTSFSFGQTVFFSMDAESKRSSSGKSSLISDISDLTSSSSSPSTGRSRSHSDGSFMAMMRSPPKTSEDTNSQSSSGPVGEKGGAEPDPFSANATTYYTPQTMIPVTPPESVSRHVRRASKEESIIFSLQTQLDLQNELCGQFEADLRARDELVEILGRKLADAEEEDAKKRKFLRAWKKKVAELEKTCRFLEDEVEGSRQDSMERSVMDEASSEALRMLHRQISGLERERDAWKRTEAVLRGEVRRLETLAGERRTEAAMLRESLGSRIEKEEEALKGALAAMEQKSDEETQRHKDVETAWQVEKDDLLATVANSECNNDELLGELDGCKQELRARDDEIATLRTELAAAQHRADQAGGFLEAAEAGKCALAMERDSLRLQVVKLQEKNAAAEVAYRDTERKVFELEDDLQGLDDVKESFATEREQLKERIREEEARVDAIIQQLKASENRVIELSQERQYALDNVSRLEDNIRRSEDSQRNLNRATDIENLMEQISRMRRDHSTVLEAALASKQKEIDAQTTALFESKAEIERLKGQTRELQQESADKEVQIVQITKQRTQDKHDLEGLNIALDSKQQELELLKRRLGVRGTAGNTPAPANKSTYQRRESLVQTTPRISRPSSFTSEAGGDSGRERKPSVEGSTKIPALSKSTRLNTSTNVAPTPSKRSSMGPPPLKPRSSIVGTPTISSRTLTRSSSLASTAGVKLRMSKPPTPQSAEQEKENADAPASSRLSRIPTLAQ
ncbi:hypothetical protein DFH07DRAFT_473315 [Mycena maculata]|uniref:Uncharacterized protein n=1 Tax=Mycena maculata TaxID=230809 RepID=A0AAD7NEE3_9AGAR|nr:hypothetical protein DFH07DRAFT_473315 [Mycena maculata]